MMAAAPALPGTAGGHFSIGERGRRRVTERAGCGHELWCGIPRRASVQKCTDAPGRAMYALHVLVLAALVVLILSLVVVMRRRTAGGEPDLGWVSERWLAEYRADSTRPSL
jgi:hypothetical protein